MNDVKTKDIIFKNVPNFHVGETLLSEWEPRFQQYVNNFIKDIFGQDIPLIKVKLNSKLTRSLGRFRYQKYTNRPVNLEFSTRLIKILDLCPNNKEIKELVESVLRHESIHYVLCYLGKPFFDGDYFFESMLSLTNTISSDFTAEKKRLKSTSSQIQAGYHGVCPECGSEFLTPGKLTYYCNNCLKTKDEKSCPTFSPTEIQIRLYSSYAYGTLEPSKEANDLIKGNINKIKPL